MDGYASPYTLDDIKDCERNFIMVEPNRKRSLGEDHEILFHHAGHIPGSIMFELVGSRKILFTGDLNVINTRLMKGTKPVPCDILFLESTYAGREHPKREDLEREFLDKIDEVVKRGGIAVIPAFAVARSQEVAMVLGNSGYDVWFDGMGEKVSKIFLRYPEYLRSAESLRKALGEIRFVHSETGRKLALKSEIILTSSGMMDGGPVLSYMNKLKNDPRSAVFLTGYQVEGTNSRLLIEKGKLDFYGVIEDVKCEVQYFDFSAHAGHSQLVEFAKACNPEKIVLFHGENREPLAESLRDFAEVYTPRNEEILYL
jgi:putative mRNA 3-end processing factor